MASPTREGLRQRPRRRRGHDDMAIGMIFGEPPPFEAVMQAIVDLEAQLNAPSALAATA